MLKRVLAVFFLMIFVFACGDDDSSVDEMNSALSDYKDSAEKYTKNYCACVVDSHYAGNMAQCVTSMAPDDIVSTSCEKKVAECYADDFGIFLRCARNATDDLANCYKSCGAAQSCVSTYQTKMSICQANVPTDLRISMDGCDSGQKFSCNK